MYVEGGGVDARQLLSLFAPVYETKLQIHNTQV
jgi:hypothetical protein